MELITLKQCHAEWERAFLLEAEFLADLLQQTVAKIHHIGSTAVPDLLAKPIVDMVIEATLFPPSQITVQELERLGYEFRGEAGIGGRYWFTKGQPRRFHLHYCDPASGVVKKQILFRDKLRANETWRRRYELIKLRNCKDRDIDNAEYASSKSAFITEAIGF